MERASDPTFLDHLDRLETFVSGASRVPLTSRLIVDEQQFIELIDQIRGLAPEELRSAKRINQDKDRVLTQARAEADRIVDEAREKATQILEQDTIVRAAHQQADAYVAEAIEQADEVRRGADTYALATLQSLEDQLTNLLSTVRRGKLALQQTLAQSVGIESESEVAHIRDHR